MKKIIFCLTIMIAFSSNTFGQTLKNSNTYKYSLTKQNTKFTLKKRIFLCANTGDNLTEDEMNVLGGKIQSVLVVGDSVTLYLYPEGVKTLNSYRKLMSMKKIKTVTIKKQSVKQ